MGGKKVTKQQVSHEKKRVHWKKKKARKTEWSSFCIPVICFSKFCLNSTFPALPPSLHMANEGRSSKSSLKATQLLTAEQTDKRERKQARSETGLLGWPGRRRGRWIIKKWERKGEEEGQIVSNEQIDNSEENLL